MGGDPAGEKAAQRHALNLSEIADSYLKDHGAKRKGSTHRWARGHVERVIKPALGAMRPDSITREDVARVHSSLSSTPIAANRALATLRALYSWAGKHGYVAEGFNPANKIAKFQEKSRERFLTNDEFSQLGDALATVEVDPAAIAAIRLLILTGARLREILHAKWEFVDFDRAVIFLPDSKTGKKPIYLSAAALSILQNLSRKNACIIPGRAGQPRANQAAVGSGDEGRRS